MSLFDRLAGRLTPHRFAKMVMEGLRDAGDERPVRYERDEFRLVHIEDGADAGVLNLANLYAEFLKVPKPQRPRALKEMVRGALAQLKEIPDDFADAAYDLRPRLWSRATLEAMRIDALRAGRGGFDSPWQPVGEHLAAVLVYDFPEAVRSISRQELEQWNVTFYEAMEAARRNLEQVQVAFAAKEPSFYGSMTGDTYDASRILMTDLVAALPVRGEPIAMVPSRDYLLISGSDDVEGLTCLIEMAESILKEESRTLSAIPLRLVNGEWEDWHAPRDHPMYERFHRLATVWLAEMYEQQKGLLDSLFADQEKDMFVASCTVIQNRVNGELSSYAMWADGVESLLPKSRELILFRPPANVLGRILWDDAAEIVGDLLEPTDDYPPRFRTREFPSESQLAELQRRFLD